MRWPSITEVAGELRLINDNTLGSVEVLLQVFADGNWAVYSGNPRIRGGQFSVEPGDAVSGTQTLPGCGGRDNMPRRFNAREVARALIESAKSAGGHRYKPHTVFFTQAGTDDYAPETQRFYPQFHSSKSYLNGLGASDESPSWQHDCDRCVFLGKYDAFLEELNRDATFDLYICVSKTHGFHTVLARFGNDAPEYLSFTVDRNVLDLFKRRPAYPLAEAYRRAVAAGFDFKRALSGLGGIGPYRTRGEPPSQPHACPVCNVDMLFPHDICPTCSKDAALVYAVPRTWGEDQLPPQHVMRKTPRKKRR